MHYSRLFQAYYMMLMGHFGPNDIRSKLPMTSYKIHMTI